MAIEFKQHWKMWSVMAASAAATLGMAVISRRASLMGRAIKSFEKSVEDYERAKAAVGSYPKDDSFERSSAERSRLWAKYKDETSYERQKELVNRDLDEFYQREKVERDRFGKEAAEERASEAVHRVRRSVNDLVEVFRSASPEEKEEMIREYKELRRIPRDPERYSPEFIAEAYRTGREL